MITPRLSPQGAGMVCIRVSHGSNDALIFGQQLADELEAYSPAGPQYQPCFLILICVQDTGNLIHLCRVESTVYEAGQSSMMVFLFSDNA